MRRLVVILLGLACICSPAQADTVRPVTVHVKETEPNRVVIQWRVPKQLPSQSIPTPRLTGTSQTTGDREVVERPGGWLLRQAYECPEGLAGNVLQVDYPLPNFAVSTLLRIDLLSGEQYVHMLAPGEDSWRIPASGTGGAPAAFRAARDGVLAGAAHFAGNPLHFVFLLSLVMGSFGHALRLGTVFSLGQLLAVGVASLSGFRLAPAYAEIGVAVAAALLAREALRAASNPRDCQALAGAAGLVHGLGIAGLAAGPSSAGAALVQGVLVVLGFDAALVLSVLAVSAVWRILPRGLGLGRAPFPAVGAYLVGGVALGLAISSPEAGSSASSGRAVAAPRVPNLGAPGGPSGSRPLAPRMPDAVLQSFISISAFEVRHEVLVRLSGLAGRVALDPAGVLSVEQQREVGERIGDLVTARTSVMIDGVPAEPVGRSVAFVAVSRRGVLRRPSPVPEPVEAAWVGVTAVHLTDATPREVTLAWERFDLAATIPATVTDPETSVSAELTEEDPVLPWVNELTHDPVPVVRTTAVAPPVVWVPLLSVALLAVAGILGVTAARGRQRALRLALGRVVVTAALFTAPVLGVAWALPMSSGSVPTSAGARRILASVLPNVYRAFEFPTESTVYDRLALSVTGETLTDVYLGHREAIEAEERGGAKTRIESVEIAEVRRVERGRPRGFVAEVAWTVGGTVTHFGHSHFRQNRYDAEVTVVPVDGTWKIQTIRVLDEERVR